MLFKICVLNLPSTIKRLIIDSREVHLLVSLMKTNSYVSAITSGSFNKINNFSNKIKFHSYLFLSEQFNNAYTDNNCPDRCLWRQFIQVQAYWRQIWPHFLVEFRLWLFWRRVETIFLGESFESIVVKGQSRKVFPFPIPRPGFGRCAVCVVVGVVPHSDVFNLSASKVWLEFFSFDQIQNCLFRLQ